MKKQKPERRERETEKRKKMASFEMDNLVLPQLHVEKPFAEFSADGGRTLKSCQHPVQIIQENWKKNEKQLKYAMLAKTFGAHMPIKLQMEEFLIRNNHTPRLAPGGGMAPLHSLEVLQSFDDELGFEDILNNPRDSETPGLRFYEQMEAHL